MNLETLRIAFILGAKFPTSRAYGITTRETLEVLLNHSIEFKLYCLRSSYSDKDFDKVKKHIFYMRIVYLSKILRFFSNYGNSKLNYLVFRLALLIDLCFNLPNIKKYAPNVVWTRDPFIAYLVLRNLPEVRVILEVHESVGKIFFKKLIKFQQIKFFPINKENNIFLLQLFGANKNYEIMPMGVRNNSVSSSNTIEQYVKNVSSTNKEVLTISYAGAFEPSGYSKGIDDLINLAMYLQNHFLPYKVQLVGASQSELFKYNSIKSDLKLSDRYLEISPHVSHSDALSIMKKSDILILPAYKSERYMGMPIKMLEYLISGKITFIGECELYRSFLPPYLYPLMYPFSDPAMLFNYIQSFLGTRNLYEFLELSVKFSSEFTWENRTMAILESIKSI